MAKCAAWTDKAPCYSVTKSERQPLVAKDVQDAKAVSPRVKIRIRKPVNQSGFKPLPLGNGVTLGGAWMVKKEEERHLRETCRELAEKLAQSEGREAVAREELAHLRRELLQEKGAVRSLKEECCDLRENLDASEASRDAMREQVDMAEQGMKEFHDYVGKTSQSMQELLAQVELLPGLNKNLEAQKEENAALALKLNEEQSKTESLEQDLMLERKKLSMMTTIKDQKEKHICLLVKEKKRLMDQVEAAMKHTRGRREGTALKKDMEKFQAKPMIFGNGGSGSCLHRKGTPTRHNMTQKIQQQQQQQQLMQKQPPPPWLKEIQQRYRKEQD
ncbi:unnamed protein product [Chrysoparadoxa australica]